MRGMHVRAIEAALQQTQQSYGAIAARRLSPFIGVEIEGLDLRAEPSAEQLAELRRALREHHVLVFRDQAISAAQHYRIAGMLGLAPEPGRRPLTHSLGGEALPAPHVASAPTWRADETYRSTPPAGAVLHIQDAPSQAAGAGPGGDMMFANMHLAYELLSSPLKALLAELTAAHTPEARAGAQDDATTAEHPVVIRHPLTGRPALFVNRTHTSHIVQLERRHSGMTLDMLCRHLEANPVLTCRIRFTRDTVVIWDNLSCQHLALQGFTPGCLAGHLVSLAGDRPQRWEP